MPNPTWRFREKQRAEVHQDSANTEFFAQQGVAERLVREAGQNTIDASSGNGAARLVFTLATVPAAAWATYFRTLWPHLEAQRELRDVLPVADRPIPCLLVEDFGTTGLTGPLEPDDRIAAEHDEKNHRLFWFFKNVGRTSKTGDQLGSFGIGKTVFPYSSRINSFFGFSVREAVDEEPAIVLLGQSYLREHRVHGSGDLDPYGFFSWHEGEGATYVQRAISEIPRLDSFRLTFGLKRMNNQAGLSVVIPYPEEGLACKDLARAAIVQFFFPILSGQLSVEIHDRDAVVLSAENLLEAIDSVEWGDDEVDGLRRQVRLAKWALEEGRAQQIKLARPSSLTQPKFEESMIHATRRTELSQRFVAGDRIALHIPVPVEPKGSDPVWSFVELFLEYERNGIGKEDLYIRKGLTLVDHTGQAQQAGLRSLLIAEDRPVYELLRSSENVAHTKWRQRGADRLGQQYIRGPMKVRYVLGVVPGLVQCLLSPEDQVDWWTLADLFPEAQPSMLPDRPLSLSDRDAASGIPHDETPTEEQDPEPVEIPPARIRQWRVNRLPDGLRIEVNPAYTAELRPMRFTAAYGLLHRRLGAHSPADFTLQETEMVEAHSAEIVAVSHNILRITPTAHDFFVQISGFDRRRALDYRLVTEGEQSPTEEE
jgi:hypothetical protein